MLIADLVRARFFAASTAREEGRLGSSDGQQLAYAAERGWTLVTHNRTDFESLVVRYFHEGRSHGGVIIAVRRSPYETAKRLLGHSSELSADDLRGQILYI